MISAIGHARGFMAAWKNSTKKRSSRTKLIAKSANAQFESLKNQLDPHFLFNSLNVLDSLIGKNPFKHNVLPILCRKFIAMFWNKKTKNWFRWKKK